MEKRNKEIVVGFIVFAIGIYAVVIGYYMLVKIRQESLGQEMKEVLEMGNKEVSMECNQEKFPSNLYFGGMTNFGDKEYSFVSVNVNTGDEKSLIPADYEIVDPHGYKVDPDFLILKKENQLYSFEINTGNIKKIEKGSLKDSEKVVLHPSISEKGKFYLVINTMKKVDPPSMYDAVPVSSREYFLDVNENKLVNANDISLTGVDMYSGCSEYDSEHERFFIWRCGEGIGSAVPLNVYDIKTKNQVEILSGKDFGEDNDYAKLEEYNGSFLAFLQGENNSLEIVVVDLDLNKESFVLSEDVRREISNSEDPYGWGTRDGYSIYSALLVKDKNTIVIGEAQDILLLRFDDNNIIVDHKFISEPKIYANFIFSHGDYLYYESNNQIKILNLNDWNVEKTISPVSRDGEYFDGINLFDLSE